MNPGENNPSTNADAGIMPGAAGAAGGDSPVPTSAPTSGPLDFTNMGAASETTGLSMADTLASAQDSLTSAGMAAQTMQGSSIGMDQITESAASATMETPDEPLVPAAPVPGSIGSVTSVPPVDAAQTAPASAPMTGAAPVAQPVAEQPAAAPYNPFATAVAQTSSSNVPTSLQPPVEKFSAKGDGKKSNILMIVLGGLAVLFAVTTIIFIVLWQNAENSKEVVYLPSVSETPVANTVSLLSCTRAEEVTEGSFEGLQSINNTEVSASFKDDELASIELSRGYVFENGDAAEATRAYFETEMVTLGALATELGVKPIEANFQITGPVVTESLKASADQLVGGYISSFMLGEGTALRNASLESVQAVYDAQGFICAAE